MVKKVVIATSNPGKVTEFEQMFAESGITVESLLDHPEIGDIAETGQTFAENAAIKAQTAAKFLGLPVIADDSGLSVDALDGAPGIYSARYAGLEKNDQANREKLLRELNDVPVGKRQAHFTCVLALADGQGQLVRDYKGQLAGEILMQEIGDNGFGYDSLFYVPSKDKTTAQMTAEEKAAISHRGQALRQLAADFNEKGSVLFANIDS
ncbi:XTP/dITP diphosphatase [Aerococcus kribbianus]|uniref:dITP/XTP pyrophosphatase n=1 Tax=Aerococcus kribbianus TaxID=2999064 RepID=A0A9X3FUC4_9LACT|nr:MULTISPECIES: XTP/dITP diphosphatase [unclassified Aerococcus]MCZ0717041.1 XTP/dITP diphosphatase [Aerococcus sp. YH-aer221]MCZ0725329.1 XTP/dITP diphosphatase [Aerococcus sp. YH-aer222]